MQAEVYWLFCFQICKLQLASGQTMSKIIFLIETKPCVDSELGGAFAVLIVTYSL